MGRIGAAVLAGLFCVGACTELPTIALETCGNGIIEPDVGEDCDTFAPEGARCREPGEPAACRFVCSDGASCPAGMGCATDEICRVASGEFSPAGSLDVEAFDLLTGDFDGDGRDDLGVETGDRLLLGYVDSGGEVEQTLTIAHPDTVTAVPVAASLSEDAVADILMPFRAGLIMALGTRNRSVRFTAHPGVLLPPEIEQLAIAAVNVNTDTPSDEFLLLGTLSGATGVAFFDLATRDIRILAPSPEPPSALSGPIVAGDLAEGPESPCEEIVIPFDGALEFFVFSPCKFAADAGVVLNEGSTLSRIELPAGSQVAGPLKLRDLDSDGHFDVLGTTRRGDSWEIVGAFGVGDGTFDSTSPAPAESGDMRATVLVSAGDARLLAIDDINSDGTPDYVTATSVYASSPSGHVPVAFNSGVPWEHGLIADLNGNTLPDVIVAPRDEAGLTFLNQGPGAIFSPVSIPTEGNVTELVIGDFDGDLLPDVAAAVAVERDSERKRDSLSVLYGRPFGAPEPPVSAGILDEVVDIIAVDTSFTESLTIPQGIDGLATVSASSDGAISVAAFSGDGSRQVRAPFAMNTASTEVLSLEAYAPERLTSGQLTDDDHVDIAAVARELDGKRWRLWLAAVVADGRIDTRLSSPSEPLPDEVDWLRSAVGAADLDGDDIDELVVFGPAADGGGRVLLAHSEADSETGAWRWVVDSITSAQDTVERSTGETASGQRPTGRLRVGDVDEDGFPDIAVMGNDGLSVYFTDGSGGLGRRVSVGGALGRRPLDFAFVGADADREREIAVLTADGVFIVDLETNPRRFRAAAEPLITAENGRLVASADLNGDGVEDLAIAADGVDVHLGTPRVE